MSSKSLIALALLAVSLAGCSGNADDGGVHGFIVKSTPADPVTEAFVFEATVSGDSFEWDMGDGRAKQSGKTVEYVYGFTDGTIKPKLTVTTAGEATTYTPRTLTLGTGQNQEPSLQMAVEWDWVTAGEPITISGAGSTDPDGDPLLFSWFCRKTSEIGLIPATGGHAHAGSGAAGFGSAGVNVIPSILLNGTDVPAADAEVTGDLCNGLLARNGVYSDEATLRGAFAETGIYEVTMLAKDPKVPGVPGSRTIYVAPSEWARPDGPVTTSVSGSFQNGAPAELDGLLEQLGQTGHIANHPFDVTFPMLAFNLDFEFDDGGGLNAVTYHILKPNGEAKFTEEASDDLSRTDPGYLVYGNAPHTLRVFGRQGVELSYSADITITYQSDPSKVFEDPSGH